MKLKLFNDRIGRIVCGEEVAAEKAGVLAIKNPVICNLVQRDPNQPAQISMLPYTFIELFDIMRHDDYVVYFNEADITIIESVGGGNLNNLSTNFVSNYKRMFENIRNYKTQSQQPVAQPAPAAAPEANANIVEVK